MGRTRGENSHNFSSEKQGRIKRLDEHTLGYYRRVSESLKEGFGTLQDKDLFLDNVFKQLSTEALEVSQNQTVSTIVELLLKEANTSHIVQLLPAFSQDWELAVTDRFACYVTQTLAHMVGKCLRLQDTAHDADSAQQDGSACHSNTLEDSLVALNAFLESNLAVHMQHTYGSHIVRVMLEVLGGVKVPESVIRSRASHQRQGASSMSRGAAMESSVLGVPSARLLALFYQLCDHILQLKKLEDHARNYLSNPVLQTMLQVLATRSPDKCDEACQALARVAQLEAEQEEEAGQSSLPQMMTDDVGSHLVEQLLNVASESHYTLLLDRAFKNRLQAMAFHPVANYIVQRLLSNCYSKPQFVALFVELCPHIESMLGSNHVGIVEKMAEGCVKHGTKQDKLIKYLMKAFHCYKPVERQNKLAPLVASMLTYENFYKIAAKKDDAEEKSDSDSSSDEDSDEEMVTLPKLTQISLHGSILLQQLLLFANPRPVVSSLLDLLPDELKTAACDPRGSHIIEAFLNSPCIGEKSREMLVHRLKGSYTELVCSRNGSRTNDALWKAASMKSKLLIAEELAQHEDRIRGDSFGHFAWRNLAMHHFIHRRQEWRDIQNGQIRKRKLFHNLISGSEDSLHKHAADEQVSNLEEATDRLKNTREKVSLTSPETERSKKAKMGTASEADHTAAVGHRRNTDSVACTDSAKVNRKHKKRKGQGKKKA